MYHGQIEEDEAEFKKRVKRFHKIKERLFLKGNELVGKISARVVSETPPRYSFFLGKKNGSDECILYIMDKPFAIDAKKGEEPGYVFIIREKVLIRRLRTIFNNEWSKGELLN